MPEEDRTTGPVQVEKIIGLLEADLAREGFELLDVRLFQGGGRYQIRIYLDTLDGGITLDEVARASRTVSMLMEEADLVDGKYVIEVSSPGIRRPLRKTEHFEGALNQKLDLKVVGPTKPSRLRGVLEEVRDGVLVIRPPAAADSQDETPPVREVPLAEVLEANLDPDFDAQALINADRRERKDKRRADRRAKSDAKRRKARPRKGSGPEKDEPGDDAGK